MRSRPVNQMIAAPPPGFKAPREKLDLQTDEAPQSDNAADAMCDRQWPAPVNRTNSSTGDAMGPLDHPFWSAATPHLAVVCRINAKRLLPPPTKHRLTKHYLQIGAGRL